MKRELVHIVSSVGDARNGTYRTKRDAGVLYFIDLLVSKYEPEQQQAYTAGLKMLAEK